MPNISVIVPCHNSSLYLKNCLDRLIAQIDSVDLEIILVDDASTDDGKTIAIMKEYEKQYPDKIMIIELSENLRQGGARNVGISYSSGEYIAFCDSDDCLVNGSLKALYKVAYDNDADVVEFDLFDTFDIGKSSKEKEVELYLQQSDIEITRTIYIESVADRKSNLFRNDSTFGHCNKLYRGDMIRNNSVLFPEHVTMEEPAFTIMVRFLERKYVRVHIPLYFVYVHNNSTIQSSYVDKKFHNAQTHMFLFNQLSSKSFFEDYIIEIQYLFWYWYFLNTILFAVTRNEFFTSNELKEIFANTKKIVPNIGDNPYFMQKWGNAIPELAAITYCDVDKVGIETLHELFVKLNNLCK